MRILSFDIEDWFHILDFGPVSDPKEWTKFERRLSGNVDRILDLLAKRDLKATFFCLGWAARHEPQTIRRIADAGHEIAAHSDHHSLIYRQTPHEFATELAEAKAVLEQVTGQAVRAYRAPGFSLREDCGWAFDILIEQGFTIDCSIFPAKRGHGGFPRFPANRPAWVRSKGRTIKEFPINTVSVLGRPVVFSGGGYFRFCPGWLVQELSKRQSYVMTYFHPRDFDPGQPVLPGLPLLRRFKSYHGLRGAEAKLEALLDRLPFISLDDADRAVDWDRAPVVDIDDAVRGAD